MAKESPPSPTSPPPPPPLPLSYIPPLQASTLKVLIEHAKRNVEVSEESMSKNHKNWFIHDPSRFFHVTNTFLQPQLQKGPTCGLVALSIASLVSDRFVDVDEIFQEAVAQGFTRQGEMFNVEYLAYLAEKCCHFNTRILSGGMEKHLFCILRNILNKNLLLVPYDCDVNHFPCLKNGAKAHWAVITGFTIRKGLGSEDTLSEKDVVLISDNYDNCDCIIVQNNLNVDPEDNFILINSNKKLFASKKPVEEISNLDDADFADVNLIGLQGKSKRFGLWDFSILAESNNNLREFPYNRDSESYVLPAGGLKKGLKGQAIILERKK